MEAFSTQQFVALPFSEKKAMLDFAEAQMNEFAGHRVKEKDSDMAKKFQEKFDKWADIRNALIIECESHVEAALGGEDFTPPLHLRS
ncbi:hypothetical protein GCM10028808_57870 [Spirosoma migulaei]